MGFFDKFTEIIREDDNDDFDDFYENDESSFGIPSPVRRERAPRKVPKEDKPERIHRSRADSDKVVNIHTTAQLQVVLVKPERYEEAAGIADNLNEKRTVVLNLESANRDVSRRLLDFLSGVAYANNGQIKKVANCTYIITPYNVDVMGDLLDELESNGMFV